MKNYLEFISEKYTISSYSKDGNLLSYNIRSPKIKKFLKNIEGKNYLYLKNDMGLSDNFYCMHVQEINRFVREGLYKILEISSRGMYNEPAWVLMKLLKDDNKVETMVLPLEEYEYEGNFAYFTEEESKNLFNSNIGINKFKL